MIVRYDDEADALYLCFRPIEPGEVKRTRMVDDRRNVDYDADGNAIGVEFIAVREGIHLDGIPRAIRLSTHRASIGRLVDWSVMDYFMPMTYANGKWNDFSTSSTSGTQCHRVCGISSRSAFRGGSLWRAS